MPLEGLLKLIEELRERIDTHRSKLKGSEALTRYALIDPLLRELGWNTADPGQVMPEYNTGGRQWVDYALLHNGKPIMMVEAKHLGKPLLDACEQNIAYCLKEGTKYFVVTDGCCWEIYETHKPVALDGKRIVSFDLIKSSPTAVSLKALALWRQSVESGEVVAGEEPVSLRNKTSKEPTPAQRQTLDGLEWQLLPEMDPGRGEAAPTAIQFPDSSIVKVRFWSDVMVESVRWLMSKNVLNDSHCPIQATPKKYLVSTKRYHPDKNLMDNPKKVASLYVNTRYSAKYCVINTQTIIRHVRQDPAKFKIRFS